MPALRINRRRPHSSRELGTHPETVADRMAQDGVQYLLPAVLGAGAENRSALRTVGRTHYCAFIARRSSSPSAIPAWTRHVWTCPGSVRRVSKRELRNDASTAASEENASAGGIVFRDAEAGSLYLRVAGPADLRRIDGNQRDVASDRLTQARLLADAGKMDEARRIVARVADLIVGWRDAKR